MKQFKIVILGCKVNAYEAQSIREDLLHSGYRETMDVADIYVVLTCAVTNVAESKTRKKLNQIKKENPKAILCVVGCYVQINHEELSQDKLISILVGSRHKDKIASYIDTYIKTNKPIYAIEQDLNDVKFEALRLHQFHRQTRAYLKIQDGCNQYCSYCIIPYARGAERSIDLDEAITQAKQLVLNGHQEIVLAGIHTGRYKDTKDRQLIDLLKELLKIEGLKRLRLSSIEITEITDEMISLMADNPKLARHLHIPLQSGSDHVLKAMNRPYDTAYFLKRIEAIREVVKDISISTDLIVGFPNETQAYFEKSYQFLKMVNFSFIHVFPFSKKKKTAACQYSNLVSDQEKKNRVEICTSLSNELYYNYQTSFIGRTLSVLVEKDGFGHSSEYIPVQTSVSTLSNQMVEVMITKIENKHLIGEVYEIK